MNETIQEEMSKRTLKIDFDNKSSTRTENMVSSERQFFSSSSTICSIICTGSRNEYNDVWKELKFYL